MSQYHVLEDAPAGNRLTVAVHTTVPVGSNNASPASTWADAAVEYLTKRDGAITSIVPGLDPVAHGMTAPATVVESVLYVDADANATPAARLTQLEAEVTAESVRVDAAIQDRLRYWGAEGSGS